MWKKKKKTRKLIKKFLYIIKNNEKEHNKIYKNWRKIKNEISLENTKFMKISHNKISVKNNKKKIFFKKSVDT